MIRHHCILGAAVAIFLALWTGAAFNHPHPVAAAALSDSSMKGKVIDLGDGHPWLWVGSTDQTGEKAGYGYIMAMYNYGNYAWGNSNTDPATAKSTTADSGTIYSNLPSTIGGIAKNTAMASNIWQWDNCSTADSCSNTTTSTSRLSFVSYKEWQGTTTSYSDEPSPGSVGNLFCQAWRGTPCVGSNLGSSFNYPWTRSGYSSHSYGAWFLLGDSSNSLSGDYVDSGHGSLLIAWLKDDFITTGGSGTFADPYTIEVDPCTLPENQNKLMCLPQGSVIDLGDGKPWLWVNSTEQTGKRAGYGYAMAMYNYGNTAWGGSNTNPNTAISTTADAGVIYSNLPATIGGIAKNTAMASNIWQWDNCSTAGSCSNTTTSTSRLSFVSYKEWQGTTTSYSGEPSSGSVGNLFCQAWKGTSCLGSNLGSTFYYPWTRSGNASSSYIAWILYGYSSYSLDYNYVGSDSGSLPIAWLSSNLCTTGGGGTFASPYNLGACSEPTLENSVANIGAFASYISGYSSLVLSGTTNDADTGQTLTVQYQIDSTAGAWSNLATLTANASNQAWSGTVNLPAGLAAGAHNVYVRVYDGYGYSSVKNMSFVLDTAAPTNTVTLIGGVKCTGIPSIYCIAPTGVNLSTSADSQAGIGAYRTAWDTNFTMAAVAPAWVSAAPTGNITTTDHTAPARTHTLYYQTRDKVGNASPVGNINYYINAAPTIVLNDSDNDRIITAYTPLVFSGTFQDNDISQTAIVKATINGVDYSSSAYPTTSGAVEWELVIPSSTLLTLTPNQLTNIALTVTDSAGMSAATTFTGQIIIETAPTAEIYLSVLKNTPFALTIGKIGAFNITYGTHNGVTVAHNEAGEVTVSGQLTSSTQITFGVTTLIVTVLDEPSMTAQEVEFV